MAHPDYPALGQTTQRWMGDVPKHWTQRPLWTMFHRRRVVDHPDEELLSVYRDYGVLHKSSRTDNFNRASEDLNAYQLVIPGDLVVNKMKAWQGSLAISSFRGIVSPAYFVYGSIHQEVPRYLHYLLRSHRYVVGYWSYSKGIRVNQWDLDPYFFSRMPVLLPPTEEQESIVRFLDHEIPNIDRAIANYASQLDTIRELRLRTRMSHLGTNAVFNADAERYDDCDLDKGAEHLVELSRHVHRAKDLLTEKRQNLLSAAVTGKIDVRQAAIM